MHSGFTEKLLAYSEKTTISEKPVPLRRQHSAKGKLTAKSSKLSKTSKA